MTRRAAGRLLALGPLLALALLPPAVGQAGASERSRHLRIGTAALSVAGLPPLTGVSGEVRVEGRALRLAGRFDLAGGSGECRLTKGSDGDVDLAVTAEGIEPPSPLLGSLAFRLVARGPEGALAGTVEGSLDDFRLLVAGAGDATVPVALGSGAFSGTFRTAGDTAEADLIATLGPSCLRASLAGPPGGGAGSVEGGLALTLRSLPLPESHPAALRLGPRLDALTLEARLLPASLAAVRFSFGAPLAAATGELTLSRAARTLEGTVEVTADRAAAGGALRFGPFDLSFGPSLRADIRLEGPLDRPAWRILRWH